MIEKNDTSLYHCKEIVKTNNWKWNCLWIFENYLNANIWNTIFGFCYKRYFQNNISLSKRFQYHQIAKYPIFVLNYPIFHFLKLAACCIILSIII
jgi:hypothetical protein